jgi:hypothetical protein
VRALRPPGPLEPDVPVVNEQAMEEEFAALAFPSQPTPAGATDPEPTPAVAAANTESDEAETEEPSEPDPFDSHPAIRHYKELTRYPASTRRLTEESFDLLNPNVRHERRRPLPDPEDNEDLAWEVRYTADRYFVHGDEPVLISLALWHEGEPVMPRDVTLVATPEVADGNGERVAIPVEPVGTELSAIFVPNDFWPSLVGQLRVTATFSAEGLQEQTGFLAFYFTGTDRIPARFTGDFGERLANGDLVIDVGIDVDVDGPYHVEGNLFDAGGRPFGWARFEGELAPGSRTVPLVFYGLLFHDANATAPFFLRQVRGYRIRRADAPHREDVPTFAGEYETSGRYELSSFREEENDSPKRQQMLELYRDALARGVRLTEPQSGDSDG